jgi:hypothetical protein
VAALAADSQVREAVVVAGEGAGEAFEEGVFTGAEELAVGFAG